MPKEVIKLTNTILIVDDNEDIRYTISEICKFADWNVAEASTGLDGVEKFKEQSPDIVLVDYHMPNWDGLKTVKELRKINKLVPIIVLTVDERQEIADQFLDAGASDFSLKPVKAPDLISRIRLNLRMAQIQQEKQEMYVDKGISPATLDMILDELGKHGDPISISEIQAKLPFAYQTVHRYMNYLVENKKVEVIAKYGKVGRPKNKYQLLKT